jgi:hypothetical protein
MSGYKMSELATLHFGASFAKEAGLEKAWAEPDHIIKLCDELESAREELARLRTCLLSYGAQYPETLYGNEMARKASYQLVEKELRQLKVVEVELSESGDSFVWTNSCEQGPSLLAAVDALRSKSNG